MNCARLGWGRRKRGYKLALTINVALSGMHVVDKSKPYCMMPLSAGIIMDRFQPKRLPIAWPATMTAIAMMNGGDVREG
jgi:hypothetical protein